MRHKWRFIFLLFFLMIACGVGFMMVRVVNPYTNYAIGIISESNPEDFKAFDTSYIYNNKGKVISKLTDGDGYGDYLTYSDIPDSCVKAFVAIEDRTFWTNRGYDLKGIMRVIINYIRYRGKVSTGGASTITQQLVRSKYLSQEKTFRRKLKEIFLAREMTKEYSKEEIMEFYVNTCYFANGVYGIEGASKYYFRKKSSELSLSQMAYLCAIPNYPAYYDPHVDPDRALKRRDKILRDMRSLEYISQEEYEDAIKEKIKIKSPKKMSLNDYQSTYAIDCAVRFLMEDSGFSFRYSFKSNKDYKSYLKSYHAKYQEERENLYQGGYKIYTSLSPGLQKKLQNSVNDEFDDKSKDDDGIYLFQAAATMIDNKSGKVVAICGGRSQEKDSYTYNRAFQAYRQPGSSIKPLIVYTPAIERGYHGNTTVYDIDVSEAKTKEWGEISEMTGPSMTMQEALEKSRNGVAYSLFNQIGPKQGLSYIQNMGFTHIVPDDYNLSSALGGLTYGVSTVEMASAYCALANEGSFKQPTCLTKIIDRHGNDIYHEDDEVGVYDSFAANEMVQLMKGVILRGTAKDMGWKSDIPAAGKTGTTSSNKDGWFCGITPYYSLAVWVGYDKPTEIPGLYGSTHPASIWKSAMEKALENKEWKDFPSFENSVDNEFFPGRSEDEVIGDGGYTVGDYRNDRSTGKDLDPIIKQINKLDYEDYYKLENLYEEGQAIIDAVLSRKYTQELQTKLDDAYEAKRSELETED